MQTHVVTYGLQYVQAYAALNVQLLRVQAVLKIILCEKVRWSVTHQFLAVVIDYAAEPDSHSGYTPPTPR